MQHPGSSGTTSSISLQHAHLLLWISRKRCVRMHWACWSLWTLWRDLKGKCHWGMWLPPPKVLGRLCNSLQEASQGVLTFSSSHSSLDQHSSGNSGCPGRRCCQVCLCSGVISWARDYMDTQQHSHQVWSPSPHQPFCQNCLFLFMTQEMSGSIKMGLWQEREWMTAIIEDSVFLRECWKQLGAFLAPSHSLACRELVSMQRVFSFRQLNLLSSSVYAFMKEEGSV